MNDYVRYFLIMVGGILGSLVLVLSIVGLFTTLGFEKVDDSNNDFDCRLCSECKQLAPTQFEQELNEFYEDCGETPRVSNWTAVRINKSKEKVSDWPDQKDELMKDE